MSDAVEIHVVDSAIVAVLVGGDWYTVHNVVVSFADFTVSHPTGPVTVSGTGRYLSAVITQGPYSGNRLLVPFRAIEAVRTT